MIIIDSDDIFYQALDELRPVALADDQRIGRYVAVALVALLLALCLFGPVIMFGVTR